jgi:hypothetical protein
VIWEGAGDHSEQERRVEGALARSFNRLCRRRRIEFTLGCLEGVRKAIAPDLADGDEPEGP